MKRAPASQVGFGNAGLGVPFRLINAPERGEFLCKMKAHRGAGAGPGLHFVRGGVRVALCGR